MRHAYLYTNILKYLFDIQNAVVKSLSAESLDYTYSHPVIFVCLYMNNVYHYLVISS